MANDKAPCHNCPERHPGCHGKCEKYQAWKAERNKITDVKYRENDEKNALFTVHRNGLKRRSKK